MTTDPALLEHLPKRVAPRREGALVLARLPEPESLLEEMGDPSTWRGTTGARHARGELHTEEIFQLTYAAQVEWGTEGTFASLDISRDPVVRRFLRVWLEQEVVHASLLAHVLDGCGVAVVPVHRERKHRWGAPHRGKVALLAVPRSMPITHDLSFHDPRSVRVRSPRLSPRSKRPSESYFDANAGSGCITSAFGWSAKN